MTPIQRYNRDIIEKGFQQDSAQRIAAEALDKLYRELIDYTNYRPPERSFLQKLMGKKAQPAKKPCGLYFWGGVGRGKTYLMDSFYHSLPGNKKLRLHFHRFMQYVHDELKRFGEIEDPLEHVAQSLSEDATVLCFDEFYVSDITDAMILATLLRALFERGVVLVATSNIPPTDLYKNGLQRARFLPAIKLIETQCQVMNLDSGIDYRLRTLQQAEIFHSPLGVQATANLDNYFSQLVNDKDTPLKHIEINHRDIEVMAAREGVLCASFAQLCQTMRSQNDYIEISKLYHTVLLADVPQLSSALDDAARRFLALVDEFYERKVKLIISCEVELACIYQHGRLEFEFQRCVSRLTEMQSHEYLASEHIP